MKKLYEDLKMCHGYEVACENCKLPFALWVVLNWRRFIWEWTRSLVCKLKGHKMVDDSYGGPESGCMSGYCERCGYSFHTDLY